jgi:hypothetical protein
MVQKAILVLLLFMAAMNMPAAFMALVNGNWPLAILYGLVVAMFVSGAVIYAALVISGKVENDD